MRTPTSRPPELLLVPLQVRLTPIPPRGFTWDQNPWRPGGVRLFGLPGVTLFGPVTMVRPFGHQASCGYGDACEVLLDLIQSSTKSCRGRRAAAPSRAAAYRDRWREC